MFVQYDYMIKTISVSEAQKKFSRITDEVGTKGQTYIIEKHGKKFVQLVPANQSLDQIAVDNNFEHDLQEFEEQYSDVLRELAKR